MSVEEILRTHRRPLIADVATLAACIDECAACAATCTICADACLAEPDIAELARCIRLCLDCADACVDAGRILSRQTDPDADMHAWPHVAPAPRSASVTRITMSTAVCPPRSAAGASAPAMTCSRPFAARDGQPDASRMGADRVVSRAATGRPSASDRTVVGCSNASNAMGDRSIAPVLSGVKRDPIGGATDKPRRRTRRAFELREIVADSSRGDWQLAGRVAKSAPSRRVKAARTTSAWA
jgi:hypothetical protein